MHKNELEAIDKVRILKLYEAGDVTRLHTVNTTRRWRISEHVYGAQLIAMELCHMNMISPAYCLEYLLTHDAPEVHTGDVPAPTKRISAAIDMALEDMENEFLEHYEVKGYLHHMRIQNVPVADPMELEVAICKLADYLDLGMTMIRERRVGNREPLLSVVFTNIIAYCSKYLWVTGARSMVNFLEDEWSAVNGG